jgi:hypothetical protein
LPAGANTTTWLPPAAFDIVNTAPTPSEAAAGIAPGPTKATITVMIAVTCLVLGRIRRI